jgi:3-hydroxyisobutyrate dehydrogenase-like beta-hydroxyacid dehydrogenase
MEPTEVLDVVVSAFFDVPIHRIYAGLIGNGRFEQVGADLRIGLKDTKLALAAGEAVNVPLPFASVIRDNYLDALAHGGAGKDWSIVSRVAFRRAGLE